MARRKPASEHENGGWMNDDQRSSVKSAAKPASETVIDQPTRPVEEPTSDVAGMTEAAQKAIVPWATGGNLEISFHPTMQEIAVMKADAVQLLADNTVEGKIITREQYGKIKAAYLEIVPKRTGADERRLEYTRQAREFTKLANSLGNAVIDALADIEAPLRAAVKEADERAEKAALEEARKEQEEVERKNRLLKEEQEAEVKRINDEAIARHKAQQEEIDAQRSELKRQQDEYEARRRKDIEEQQAAQKKIDDARRELEAEQKRIEDAKLEAKRAAEEEERKKVRAAEEAKAEARRREEAIAAEARRAAELEEARKAAAEEAVAKAERDRLTAERLKREEEELAEIERQRKAAMAPDKDKLTVFIKAIRAPLCPDLKTKEAKAALLKCTTALTTAIMDLEDFVQGKMP